MKILKRQLEKNGAGFIKVKPEEDEDLWHLYHLIAIGDSVESTTIRRVVKESSSGSVTSDRVRLRLKLLIDDVDFAPEAGTLRLKGKNQTESPHIRLGASHTLDLELNRDVTLHKAMWDRVALKRLHDAADPATTADAVAIMMDEGLAYLFLLKPNMTITAARIEVSIPRKRRGSSTQHEKGMERFFEQILQAIQSKIRFDIVKVVLVASPGFIRDSFLTWLWATVIKRNLRSLQDNKAKFVAIHCSSGHKHALNEVLSSPAASALIADTKARNETRAIEVFYEMLRNDPGRAFYGFKHCEYANEHKAIDTLLITDELLRAASVQQRRRYIQFMDDCQANGATIHVFSSLHPSGEQLQQLTGVAAILRYALDDPNDEESEDQAASSAVNATDDNDNIDADDYRVDDTQQSSAR